MRRQLGLAPIPIKRELRQTINLFPVPEAPSPLYLCWQTSERNLTEHCQLPTKDSSSTTLKRNPLLALSLQCTLN